MQKQESQEKRKKKCSFCYQKICVGNFELHLTKCKKKQQKQSKLNKKSNSISNSVKNQLPKTQGNQEQKNENKQELFPCHLCGFPQKMTDLDLHPKRCPNRQVDCRFCHQKYPKNIMFDHTRVCTQSPSNRVPSSTSSPQNLPNPINPESASNRTQESISSQRTAEHSNGTIKNFRRIQAIQPSQSPSSSEQRRRQDNTQTRELFRNYERRVTAMIQAQNRMRRILQNQLSQRIQQGQMGPRHPLQRGEPFQYFYQALMDNRPQHLNQRIDSHIRNSMRQQHLTRQLANRFMTNVNKGITFGQVKLIPQKIYSKESQNNVDCCSICCVEFQEDDILKDLKCKHDFHSKCISDWLRINSSCPLCKTDLSVNVRKKVDEKTKTEQETKPTTNLTKARSLIEMLHTQEQDSSGSQDSY